MAYDSRLCLCKRPIYNHIEFASLQRRDPAKKCISFLSVYETLQVMTERSEGIKKYPMRDLQVEHFFFLLLFLLPRQQHHSLLGFPIGFPLQLLLPVDTTPRPNSNWILSVSSVLLCQHLPRLLLSNCYLGFHSFG